MRRTERTPLLQARARSDASEPPLADIRNSRLFRPSGRRAPGLRSLRAPSACATACDNGGPPRLFPVRAAPRASRNCGEASFLERPPRVAFSSSRLAEPDRRCCRERGLARGATPRLNSQAGRGGDPYALLFNIPGVECEAARANRRSAPGAERSLQM